MDRLAGKIKYAGLAAILSAGVLTAGCESFGEFASGAAQVGFMVLQEEAARQAAQAQYDESKNDPNAPGYEITSGTYSDWSGCRRFYVDKRDDERIMHPVRYEARIPCGGSADDFTLTEILDAVGYCEGSGYCDMEELHHRHHADSEWQQSFMEVREAYIYQERNR